MKIFLDWSSPTHIRREERCLPLSKRKLGEDIGISIELEKIEWNQFRNRLEKGHFAITGTIQDTQDIDSPKFYENWKGQVLGISRNGGTQKYHSMIECAKGEVDLDKRQNLLLQAEAIIQSEMPFAPIFKYTHLFAHSHDLDGYLFDKEGCVDFSRAYACSFKK